MKKIFLGMFAAAAALFATSCSSEDFATEQNGNEITATFSVNAPKSINSRAIADGNTVDKVVCAVYDANEEEITELRQYADMTSGKANFNTRLVKGQAYRIAFFAYNEDADAYDVTDLKNIVVKGDQLSNREDRDAFTAKIDITANESTSAINKTVKLYRPFAQLNIATEGCDWEDAVKADIKVAKTYVKVTDVYTAFNAYADEVVEDSLKSEMVFALNDTLPTAEKLTIEGKDYTYLAMNYLLVDKTKSLTNIEFLWEAENGKKNDPITTFANVPVQRNYRTNILGNILTNPANIQIVVDAQFDDEYQYYTGIIPVGNNTYEVNSPEGMIEIAGLIAAENPTEGKIITINMTEDIDMAGYAWTPMAAHWVNFNGQGHTISNLNCGADATGKSGFCGYLGASTIKNLTLHNVTAAGEQVGIIAGLAEAGTLENVTITGQNSASYLNTAYDESWGGVGAIFGVNTGGERTVGVTVAEGATIYVEKNDMVTEAPEGNKYAMLAGVTVTDNGSVKLVNMLADGLLYDVEAKNYEVSTATGLVALTETTIEGGQNVLLTADIDLAGVEFAGLSAFNSNKNTFDGQGFTVSNVTNTSNSSDMAFIKSWVGPIKNVTIENANFKTKGRSAILAAKVYADIDNCHIVGGSIEDTYWACGMIAGLYNNGNITNCTVSGAKVKSNGGTGGIVGVINETGGERRIENCSVVNCEIINTGVYGEVYAGGAIAGIINVDNSEVTFANCVVENCNIDNVYGWAEESTIVVVDGNATAHVSTQESLEAALNKTGFSQLAVYLNAGDYALNNTSNLKNTDNVSIIGKDKDNVKVTITGQIRANDGVTSLTLKNLTTNVPAGLYYSEHTFGWMHYLKEFKMIDCKSNGHIRLNVHNAVIENCEFNVAETGGEDGYAIRYSGANNSKLTVSNSTFNTAGKAILLHSDGVVGLNLDVEGCTFTSNQVVDGKTAIQMHTEAGITGTLNITNTTATGYDDSINSGLWNELNNSTGVATDNFDITVDGVLVH